MKLYRSLKPLRFAVAGAVAGLALAAAVACGGTVNGFEECEAG